MDSGLDRATTIAVAETTNFLEREASVERVLFVCFGEAAYESYTAALGEVTE